MVLYSEHIEILVFGMLNVFVLIGVISRLSSDNGKISDIDLIRRAKQNDTRAFDQLVERYQQKLYYVVIRILLNHEDANDVVQDSFLKAYRNLERFDEKYRFYTWIHRIAVNTAINLVQHRKHRESSLEKHKEDTGFDPADKSNHEDDFEFNEVKIQVKTALKCLSPDMRAVFILRVYEDLSYSEIAETLDISIGTVMSRLNRARKNLKLYLEKEEILFPSGMAFTTNI